MDITYYDIGLNLFTRSFPRPERILADAFRPMASAVSSPGQKTGKTAKSMRLSKITMPMGRQASILMRQMKPGKRI